MEKTKQTTVLVKISKSMFWTYALFTALSFGALAASACGWKVPQLSAEEVMPKTAEQIIIDKLENARKKAHVGLDMYLEGQAEVNAIAQEVEAARSEILNAFVMSDQESTSTPSF